MNVDKSDARVKRMFGEIAPRYDLMNHLLSMNIDRYWRWKTVRRVAPQGGSPILDVCTGTGDLAFAYLRHVQPGTRVVATDFCLEMLKVGRRKQRRQARAGQVTFIEADTQHLPFANDLFQIVSVAFGLRNVADTDRGLAEMARVCKPGGKVAVLEFSQPSWQPFKALHGIYMNYLLPRIGQLLARNKENAYNYLPESVSEFPSGRALVERMEKSGLKEVGQHRLSFGIATLYVGVK
jgi:demethylmenaquinone methyltransferase/2-methoxy-6-polyprenyl-1,4-benzoquinol methylase